MTKILDIQQSITAANGNASLAKDLFTMLLNDLDTRLDQIKNSYQSDDLESLAEHVHKLYGATAYCIVPKLRKNTEILDTILKQKDYSQLTVMLENVITEIQQLINEGPAFIEKEWG